MPTKTCGWRHIMGVSVLRKRDLSFHNIKFNGGTLYGNDVFEANNKDYVIISKNFGRAQDSLLIAPIVPDQLQSSKFNQ